MNKNKIIAGLIFLFIFLVPFRMLFFTDEIVHGGKFIALLMTNVIGFFVAFGIGTNEPFSKKAEVKLKKETGAEKERMKEAA
jgi:hypothetical protein